MKYRIVRCEKEDEQLIANKGIRYLNKGDLVTIDDYNIGVVEWKEYDFELKIFTVYVDW
jgi:hypothetical protein